MLQTDDSVVQLIVEDVVKVYFGPQCGLYAAEVVKKVTVLSVYLPITSRIVASIYLI